MTRPSVREILAEAADTQHSAVLTWQEARAVLDLLTALQQLPDAMARSWGADASWLTTGTKIGELVQEWIDAELEDQLNRPGQPTQPTATRAATTSEGARHE